MTNHVGMYDTPAKALRGILIRNDTAAAEAALSFIADACIKNEPIPTPLRAYLTIAIRRALNAKPNSMEGVLAVALGIGRSKKDKRRAQADFHEVAAYVREHTALYRVAKVRAPVGKAIAKAAEEYCVSPERIKQHLASDRKALMRLQSACFEDGLPAKIYSKSKK